MLQVETETQVERLSWPDFQREFSWTQGEHVSLIGATGCGKTTLAHYLLPLPKWVVVLATKPKDSSMDKLVRSGYKKIPEWPPQSYENRVVLWPPITKRLMIFQQRRIFHAALNAIYEAGAWCVYADELGYMVSDLKLPASFNALWTQGRSLGISLVASMQRPSHVPLNAYTQATHLFFWRQNDERDLKTVGGIGWLNSRLIRSVVSQLAGPPAAGWSKTECCEFLYVNVRSGRLIVSRIEGVK